jgi:hypothetical protein
MSRRVEAEGESFLTITLPKYGKAFEKALDQGFLSPNSMTGFRFRGGLPLFLRGFLENIFDAESGVLLNEVCTHSIFAVRQLCYLAKKVELECSPRRVAAAYARYVEVDKQVEASDSLLSEEMVADFGRVGRILFARLFSRADHEVAYYGLLPSHGPGATANRVGGNAKYDALEWTARLDRVFPSSEYLVPNLRFHQHVDSALLLEPGYEQPVKVTHVPKTLEKPRIIAEEPSYMMFMQQALWREFKTGVLDDDLLRPFIDFTDQEPNRRMARLGSISGELATLDLSDASDRVSNVLVRELLRNHPHLREGVDACRSRTALVPGHGVIPLTKFASMGSALCFPFEAMVFLTIVLLGIEKAQNTKLTRKDIMSLRGKVRVYGDDIIVPTDYTRFVCDMLEAYGLRVNYDKSFWTGKFRESCGGDFYAGVDTTPVRATQPLPITHGNATGVVAWSAFRNHAYMRDFHRTVQALDHELGRVLKGLYPVVGQNSPIIGRWSLTGSEPERISPSNPLKGLETGTFEGSLHRLEVHGWEAVPIKRRNELDGVGALMKYFLNASGLPVTDREHLVYSGRPVSVTLKKRWGPAD